MEEKGENEEGCVAGAWAILLLTQTNADRV
jgi:hypothetical protein